MNFATNVPSVDVVSDLLMMSSAILMSWQNNVAQAGTLVLEFNRLSLYSGNATYKALAEKAMRTVATAVSQISLFMVHGLSLTC